MPLIQITAQPDYYPSDDLSVVNSPHQEMVAGFGNSLPALLVAKIDDLHMDADTPEAGVQVTFHKFHSRDVNAPDLWILIEFSEDGLDEVQQTEATAKVKQMLLDWWGDDLPANYACDIHWSPSHGFLRIGGIVADW